MPNGEHIDWERTGLLLGVALAAIALLGKVTSWAPIRWAWRRVRALFRWGGRGVVTALFIDEIKATANREVRITDLETIVVRLERDITLVGDKVTMALTEIGERVDASVCACRDSIADLSHDTRNSIDQLTEAQRGTNRILASLVALEVGPDETRKALAESMFQGEPRSEYGGEDRRSRRARGDRPGEEPKREKGEERRERRTRDDE